MGTCKTCGKKCDKEYCFQHKTRKRMPTSNLTKSVNKRKKLLAYLKKNNPVSYQKVIKQLNLRK